MIKKYSTFSGFVMITMLAVSLFCTIFVAFWEKPEIYTLLWLMPASFTLSCIIINSFFQYLFTKVSVTCITGLFFIKMVVNPVTMCLGDYAMITENRSFLQYMPSAICLLSLETISVFIALLLVLRNRDFSPYVVQQPTHSKYNKLFYIIVGLLLLYMAVVAVIDFSIIRSRFSIIIGTPKDWISGSVADIKVEDFQNSGIDISYEKFVLLKFFGITIYHVFVLIQFLVPALLCNILLKKVDKISEKAVVFYFFIIFFSLMMICSEEKINSIIIAISLLFAFLNIYRKNMIKLIPLFLAVIILVGAAGLFLKSDTGINPDRITIFDENPLSVPNSKPQSTLPTQPGSEDPNSPNTNEKEQPQLNGGYISNDTLYLINIISTTYFGGPQNIAAAMEMKEIYGTDDNFAILKDHISSFPYLSILFKPWRLENSVIKFNNVLYGELQGSKNADQLLPTVGINYNYFGILGALFMSSAIAILAIKFEFWAYKSKNLLVKIVMFFGTMTLSFTLTNYCTTNWMGFLFYILCVMAINALGTINFKKANKAFKLKRRKNGTNCSFGDLSDL